MTGLESILVLLKIGTPLIIIILSAIGKFLWDIKVTSKQTEKDFHNFKTEFREELVGVKHQLERVSDKIKDSFSKSETTNLLLQLENKLTEKMYSLVNAHNQKIQKNNNTTKE